MKMKFGLVLVIAFGLFLSACAPKVPVVCGDDIIKVKVDDVASYKEACGIPTETSDSVDDNDCECNCCDNNAPATEPATPPAEVNSGEMEKGDQNDCLYAAGFDSQGQVVPSGTKVVGPAVIKPNRDKDHAIVVNVDVQYITSASDEVVWLLIGDNACALANAEPFFSTYEVKSH